MLHLFDSAHGDDVFMFFSQIIDQSSAKDFLKSVISRKRIPHGYLFTGIPGIGKTSTAKALTVALNCHDPVDFDGCGRCPVCHQIRGGNFPDFLSIKPEGQNIRIEQVRELDRKLSFPPVTGRYRVSVIHEAVRMTGEAANAFLKTLEEPPPQNILVLTTTEPFDLLPTIVSRCQRVAFQPLPVAQMADWLVTEKRMEKKQAAILSRASEGSLGVALKMLESDFLKKRGEWLASLRKLFTSSKAEVLDMAVTSTEGKNRWGLRSSDTGETGLMDMLDTWETWFRDLLLIRVGGSQQLIVNRDFMDQLKSLAANFEIEGLIKALFALDRALNDLRRMRNPALVMENTVLDLRRFALTG
ncbi:MAG: DNA polymerase III subunit delta' [Thermodesulfobacteriota bacterium]